jgi:hypothetical protein
MKQKTITTPPFKLNGRSLRRYQKGNQNPFIEEEQTTQWPKEKVQKDKQRSTKHTHKTKYRVTRTMNSTKTRGELTINFCPMSQDVEKLRCRILQVPLYKITSVMKVETDIISSIVASPIGTSWDTSDNVCQNLKI